MKNKDTILSVIRHVLTFGGGFLVAKGVVSDSALATLIPALVAAVGAVWGAADEFLAARKAAPVPAAPVA
ncbi:MAG: hypothetical protein H7067_07670 [Burkholderiales bacterium]|nr:hypothetical protein [Opitutaceae bacterium]